MVYRQQRAQVFSQLEALSLELELGSMDIDLDDSLFDDDNGGLTSASSISSFTSSIKAVTEEEEHEPEDGLHQFNQRRYDQLSRASENMSNMLEVLEQVANAETEKWENELMQFCNDFSELPCVHTERVPMWFMPYRLRRLGKRGQGKRKEETVVKKMELIPNVKEPVKKLKTPIKERVTVKLISNEKEKKKSEEFSKPHQKVPPISIPNPPISTTSSSAPSPTSIASRIAQLSDNSSTKITKTTPKPLTKLIVPPPSDVPRKKIVTGGTSVQDRLRSIQAQQQNKPPPRALRVDGTAVSSPTQNRSISARAAMFEQ